MRRLAILDHKTDRYGGSVLEQAFPISRLAWAENAVEAVDNFVSWCLPFFCWFACGVVVGLALFVGWMTFVPGLPIEPELSLENYFDVFDSYLCASGHRFHSER